MSYYIPPDDQEEEADGYYPDGSGERQPETDEYYHGAALPFHAHHDAAFAAAMPAQHDPQRFGPRPLDVPPPMAGPRPAALDPAAGQRKADEPDPSCRPRLTTEQTNTLEHYFHLNPRPTTQEKRVHAMELGLTLEKVNNWYQNRRAKVKQQNRCRKDLTVFAHGDAAWPGRPEYSSDGTAPDFGSESEPTPPPPPMSSDPVGPFGPPADETAWPEPRHRFVHAPPPAYAGGDAFAGHEPAGPEYAVGVDACYPAGDDGPPPHFQPTWPAAAFVAWPHPDFAPAVETDPRAQAGEAFAHRQAGRPQPPHGWHGHDRASTSHSPAPSVHALPPQSFSRRSSDSSELATDFDSFTLQRAGSLPGPADDLMQAAQIIRQSDLAARRKRQRPAPLGGARTASTAVAGHVSPRPKPRTLRHATSAGNNLNVLRGRVQKAGLPSAQRSPLCPPSFHEAASCQRRSSSAEHLMVRQAAAAFQRRSSCAEHLIVGATGAPSAEPAEPMPECGYFSAAAPADGYFGPAMAAGYDAAFSLASPPASPFVHASLYGQHQLAYMMPPQSAPAHISSFANLSPPMQPMPETPGFYPPQAEPYGFYAGGPLAPHLHMPTYQLGPPMVQSHTPQIVGMSPTLPSYFHAYAPPAPAPPSPPPKKELEVILSTFPIPVGPILPKPMRPLQYTFQNSGPCDFESDSS